MIPLLASAAVATVAPLSPLNKWEIDYGAKACILGRRFGTDDHVVTLGISALPLSQTATFMLAQRARFMTTPSGKVTVSIEPGGKQNEGFADYGQTADGSRLITIGTPLTMGDFAAATTITFTLEDKSTVALRLDTGVKAANAFFVCQNDLAKRWGLDVEEARLIETPAKPKGPMLTADDYPTEAVRDHVQGTTIVAFLVGLDGRTSECRVVSSSGSATIDEATCKAITRRDSYQPAIGKDGRPMASHSLHKAVWRLPG